MSHVLYSFHLLLIWFFQDSYLHIKHKGESKGMESEGGKVSTGAYPCWQVAEAGSQVESL